VSDSPQPAIDRGVDSGKHILDSPLRLTGAIYKLAPVTRRGSHPAGSWNLFEISAIDPLITVKLNRVDVSRLDNAPRECGAATSDCRTITRAQPCSSAICVSFRSRSAK